MAAVKKIEDDIIDSRNTRNAHIIATGNDTPLIDRKVIAKRIATMKANERKFIEKIKLMKDIRDEIWFNNWSRIEDDLLQILPQIDINEAQKNPKQRAVLQYW